MSKYMDTANRIFSGARAEIEAKGMKWTVEGPVRAQLALLMEAQERIEALENALGSDEALDDREIEEQFSAELE